jgi:WD40 repeat protein
VTLLGCARIPPTVRPAIGGTTPKVLQVGAGAVTLVGFAVNRGHLVTALPRLLVVWDIDKESIARTEDFGPGINPLSRAHSPNGRQLAFNFVTAMPDGNNQYDTRLVDVESGETIVLQPFATNSSGELAINPKGTNLMRASWDISKGEVTVQWWRLPSGLPLRAGKIENADSPSGTLAISPKGDRMAIGIHRRTRENPNPPSPVGSILICDGATMKVLLRIPTPNIPRGMVFSSNGLQLFSGMDGDDRIHVWNVKTGRETVAFGNHGGPVQLIRLSPDGRWLAAASHRGTFVQIWDSTRHALLHTVMLEVPPYSLAISPSGRNVAIGMQNGAVWICDVK